MDILEIYKECVEIFEKIGYPVRISYKNKKWLYGPSEKTPWLALGMNQTLSQHRG